MKYLLIRNCRIPNYNPQELFSVLIGGNKILQIDKNIMHPAIDTREYDAQGNVLIPSLVDVASDFGEASTEDDLTKTAIADVEAAENCVSDELEMLAATEREVTNTINSIEDGTLSVLLYERYINSKTWEQIAVILNYSYVHVVHRLHPLALRAVQMMSEKS